MAEITRSAEAEWIGDQRGGAGKITSPSGVLQGDAYTWAGRFEQAPGTNPEELIAAAHAACFSMAFVGALGKKGYQPERLHTRATCIMTPKEGGGWSITKMRLEVEGRAGGADAQAFQQVAEEAEKGCPVSRLLRPGLQEIELIVKMI